MLTIRSYASPPPSPYNFSSISPYLSLFTSFALQFVHGSVRHPMKTLYAASFPPLYVFAVNRYEAHTCKINSRHHPLLTSSSLCSPLHGSPVHSPLFTEFRPLTFESLNPLRRASPCRTPRDRFVDFARNVIPSDHSLPPTSVRLPFDS